MMIRIHLSDRKRLETVKRKEIGVISSSWSMNLTYVCLLQLKSPPSSVEFHSLKTTDLDKAMDPFQIRILWPLRGNMFILIVISLSQHMHIHKIWIILLKIRMFLILF
jgi:hypothetical protein